MSRCQQAICAALLGCLSAWSCLSASAEYFCPPSRTAEVEGFIRYTDGTFCNFVAPGGISYRNALSGISSNASMIVGTTVLSFNGFYTEGFVNAPGFMPLNFPGAVRSTAVAVNDHGDVIGSYTYFDKTYVDGSYLYSADAYSSIVYPGSQLTVAKGINNSGVIVGTYFDGTQYYGFIDNNRVFIPFAIAGATNVYLSGINNNGQMVGGYLVGGFWHSFVDTGGTLIPISYPGAPSTQAYGINDAGQIVGTYTLYSGYRHGFLYSGGVFTTIDYPGTYQTDLTGISNGGVMVGRATYFIPEPSSLVLFGVGVATLGTSIRRKRL